MARVVEVPLPVEVLSHQRSHLQKVLTGHKHTEMRMGLNMNPFVLSVILKLYKVVLCTVYFLIISKLHEILMNFQIFIKRNTGSCIMCQVSLHEFGCKISWILTLGWCEGRIPNPNPMAFVHWLIASLTSTYVCLFVCANIVSKQTSTICRLFQMLTFCSWLYLPLKTF